MLSTISWSVYTIAAELNQNYISFDVPHATKTTPTSINEAGTITGAACAASLCQGFVRTANGNIETFSVKGESFTFPISINKAGTIVGMTGTETSKEQYKISGFIRSPKGEITKFDVDGADWVFTDSMNDAGVITGFIAKNTDYTQDKTFQVFMRSADGKITLLNDPQEYNMPITNINNAGTIVFTHGKQLFIRTNDGNITPINTQENTGIDTVVINDDGMIAGSYMMNNTYDPPYGFIGNTDSMLTEFSVPNAEYFTSIAGFNQAKTIIGNIFGKNKLHRGFIRTNNGKIATINYPNAKTTSVNSINKAGIITGEYSMDDEQYHGFILKTNNDASTLN